MDTQLPYIVSSFLMVPVSLSALSPDRSTWLGADHLISGGGVEENMEINKMFPILLKINKLFPSLLEINKLFLKLPEKNELFHPKKNLFVGLIP